MSRNRTLSRAHAEPAFAALAAPASRRWRKHALALATALPLLAAAAFLATTAPRAQAQPAAAAADWTEAEVRKVDREGNKLTLKHAEIKSLDMPPMTMVFVARDKAMLEGLQTGSKIRFRAGKDKGQYMVLELQKAP